MAYHELAIFFDMRESEGKRYVVEAWECFMRNCSPEIIRNAQLFHGEVSGLLPDGVRMFCIAVRSENMETTRYLKAVFASCNDKCLASPLDRIRETGIIQEFSLKYYGRVDSRGRLKTKKWSQTTHSLCMARGWPYVPGSYPETLPPETMNELERMKRPGLRTPVPAVSEIKDTKKHHRKLKRKIEISPILKRTAWYVSIILLVAILVTAWATRGKYVGPYLQKRHEQKLQRILGPDGYTAYNKNFSLVNIPVIPPELPLDELNKVLGKKGYFVLQCSDESFVNATMQCTLHFPDRRGPRDKTRVRVTFKMKTVDGGKFWAHKGTGATAQQESVAEHERKREAVMAAIKDIDLLYLPKGRVLREEGPMMAKLENDQKIRGVLSRREKKKKEKILRADMERRVSKQWIMNNRLVMKSGQRLDVIVLRRTPKVLNVMTGKDRRMISLPDIKRIESFDEERYAEYIRKIISPMRERLTQKWEQAACDNHISTMSSKFAEYGPIFPEACVIRLEPCNEAGELRARVKAEDKELELEVGDKISGFEVIGMDSQTNTVLLRWGKGGDVLRIWPEARI